MIEDFILRLREIEIAYVNQDLNRVSRRLMDLTHDYDLEKSLQLLAVKLRLKYNLNKDLGKSGNNNQEISEAYQNLIDSIKQIKDVNHPIQEEKEIICKAHQISKSLGSFKLEKIDIELQRGKIIGLVGENGNGKTTLLRVLSGEISCDEGTITYYYAGEQLTTWEAIKTELAFIPQRIERWFGTVYEQISFCAAAKGIKGERNVYESNFILHRLGLSSFKNHTWSELSSGYKLRVEIAKILVWKPKVLLLDEPLANLDLMAQELLLQDLKDLTQSVKHPVTLILTSQQLHEVETIADIVVFLKNGRAVFNGKISDLSNLESEHTIELDGKFDYDALNACLLEFKARVEKNSLGYLIYLPKQVTITDFLQKITQENLEITYFRNITSSTKKLFNDKY